MRSEVFPHPVQVPLQAPEQETVATGEGRGGQSAVNFPPHNSIGSTSDFADKSQAGSTSDFGNKSQAGSTNGAATGKVTLAPNLFSAPARPLSLGQVRGERSSAPLKKDAPSVVASIHPEAPRASVPVPVLLRRSKKLLQRVKEEAANRR